MNHQPDWHYFYHPPRGEGLATTHQSSLPYGDFLLSPYPISDESYIGGTVVSLSRTLRPIPSLIGHVSLLLPDSSHDLTPQADPRTHYLGEAIKIGMTFATGYEFRVARHTNNLTAIVHWQAKNQTALVAAAAEHLLCESGVTANSKNPPVHEKRAHLDMLNHVTGLLRDARLPNNVRHAFLNAVDVLHIAISCAHYNPGLALSLSVASIEAGADCFFGKDRSRLLNPNEAGDIKAAESLGKVFMEKHREKLSPEDLALFGKLVGNTKTLIHDQRHYTKRKFLLFCEEFAPYSLWDELARHPYFEISGGNNLMMPQSHFSAAPSQLDKSDLRLLLEDTYAFRNKYVHCALRPTALATPTPDTYFETFFDFEEECFCRAIKPSLIIGIARKALVAWLEQSLASSHESAHPAPLI